MYFPGSYRVEYNLVSFDYNASFHLQWNRGFEPQCIQTGEVFEI